MSLEDTLVNCLKAARDNGVVEKGDVVVITAGDPHTTPRADYYTSSTNMVMVAQVQ